MTVLLCFCRGVPCFAPNLARHSFLLCSVWVPTHGISWLLMPSTSCDQGDPNPKNNTSTKADQMDEDDPVLKTRVKVLVNIKLMADAQVS